MTFTVDVLEVAHKHCARHEAEINASNTCGCFYCLATFPAAKIDDWIDDDPRTAHCPECWIDAVIGDASGYPVTDAGFLSAMRAHWFESTVSLEEFTRLYWWARLKARLGRAMHWLGRRGQTR